MFHTFLNFVKSYVSASAHNRAEAETYLGFTAPLAPVKPSPSYKSVLLGPLITKLCGRDKDSTWNDVYIFPLRPFGPILANISRFFYAASLSRQNLQIVRLHNSLLESVFSQSYSFVTSSHMGPFADGPNFKNMCSVRCR